MDNRLLPDAFLLKAIGTFLSGDRRLDRAAGTALQVFLEKAEVSAENLEILEAKLDDPEAISEFIEETRSDIKSKKYAAQNEFQATLLRTFQADTGNRLDSIEGNTQQSLIALGVLRAEFSQVLGDMRAEFGGLFTTLHAHVGDIKAATQKNIETGEEIHAASKEIRNATQEIRAEIPKISSNAAAAAKASTRKASIYTALIVSPIAVITGILGNKVTGFIDSLSVPKQTQEEVLKPNTSETFIRLSPLLPSCPVPLEFGSYGLYSTNSGQNILELLESGNTVTVPLPSGSKNLKLNAPVKRDKASTKHEDSHTSDGISRFPKHPRHYGKAGGHHSVRCEQ